MIGLCLARNHTAGHYARPLHDTLDHHDNDMLNKSITSRLLQAGALHLHHSTLRFPFCHRAMASSSIPKTMSGVIIESTGGTEVLQYKTNLPVPEPKDGQILIKNEYIGVNFIDT